MPSHYASLSNIGQPVQPGQTNPQFGNVPNFGIPKVQTGEVDLTWLQKLIGSTSEDGTQQGGYGQLALGAAQGAASTFLGLKQYGLAKDSFKQNKREFGLNYDANRTLTNSRLEDRQRARVATGNSGYQSVSSYLDQNAVAPRG